MKFVPDNYSFDLSMSDGEKEYENDDFDDISESDIIYYIQDILRSVGINIYE